VGVRMSSEFERMVEERRLTRFKADRSLVLKEMREAEADLVEARDSLERSKFKWATIQGYYSMFHAVRALVYSRGFREKSHYALLVALRNLLIKELGTELIEGFGDAMSLREEADYGLTFSKAGAIETIETAEAFFKRAKEILKI